VKGVLAGVLSTVPTQALISLLAVFVAVGIIIALIPRK